MKIKYFEYIAICLSVFLACIFIGNAVENILLEMEQMNLQLICFSEVVLVWVY
jgi:hypothetical protein